jgi:hypothetical protein
MKHTPKKTIKASCLALVVAFILFGYLNLSAQNATVPPVGTHAIFGEVDGVSIEGMIQSPSNEETPLQIVCVFEYIKGDAFDTPGSLPANANGMQHVDKQLHGLITELRKSGKFQGHALETFLIIPPKGTILAKRLLLIGLGDRNKFTPDQMVDVGRVGMREALRMGVTSYTHASDLKDGGLDSPTALIISNVLKGAFDAYETEMFLKSKHLAESKPITKLTLLAGQVFYAPSGEAMKEFIVAHKN